MPILNGLQWVRTLNIGEQLGFRYEPGSALKAIGVMDEYFALSNEWVEMKQDSAQMAQFRFPNHLEVTETDPYLYGVPLEPDSDLPNSGSDPE